MTKKRRNIVAGDVPRAVINNLAKKLAYRFGAAAKEGAGLTLPGIIKAIKEPQIEYDELRGYIYGPELIGLKPFEGETRGPAHSSLISSKEAKEYNGILNPDNEYVFPEQVRPVLESAANSGSNIYLNADDLPFTGVDRYDAANHPVRVHYDVNGNIVGSAADIYDFDTGYMRRYKAPSWQVLAMKPVGEPYIVRQDNIPIRFVGENDDIIDRMKAEHTMSAWGAAEKPHRKKNFGELPGQSGGDYREPESVAVESTLLRAGIPMIEPAIVEAEYSYSNGGSIHIKPSHRGRLTELKARTGKTEAELYNDGNPAHKRMVVFARNARKWSHADGGLLETPEKTEYANKWDSISNARYGMANDALLRSGSNAKDADRLARFLASQSALEAGWVDEAKGNNYAGYMSNGKRMSFDSTDDFWDYHIKNLDERWPEWRKAQTIDDYYNTINNTVLGLTTKELFDEYNRNHRDNPAYIYAPDWENENYLKKLQSIYNKYISTYVKPMFDAGGMLRRMSSIYKTKEEMLAAIERAKANK